MAAVKIKSGTCACVSTARGLEILSCEGIRDLESTWPHTLIMPLPAGSADEVGQAYQLW